ncbi:MAG: hypothetical protein VR64_15885 [Desulfatitalea sp. BRH_c12]|nr:MAG: hypothetical protein VR64_15885 [Desulfatitalea sp. BRH_c12]
MIALQEEGTGFICRGELICGLKWVPLFYEERLFAPIWLDGHGMRPMAQSLIRAIEQSDHDGLQPGDYHLSAIRAMLDEMQTQKVAPSEQDAAQWAEFELLLTDAFLLLSSHLASGRVSPETLHTDWLLSDHSVDIMAALHHVATEDQLDRVIDKLAPVHLGYAALKAALWHMRSIEQQGGWPLVEAGATLRPGDRDTRIVALRDRLRSSGDMPAAEQDPEIVDFFDPLLEEGLKRFQERHGLEPDGHVGAKTLAELNVSVQERIRQIEINLERWRWMPHDLGERYIEVNTADFSLRVMDAGQTALRMRVVVGRPARRTPVFSSPMTYMVVNPYWTVPYKIAVEDILPKVVEDASYLERQGIKVYHGWDEDAPAMDPHYIDWQNYGKFNFPFRLVQDPGPTNSLGRLKFMFPNHFAVYLHDTPNRALFGRVQRDFSSGCIRVEDAVALATYLVKDDSEWSVERLNNVIGRKRQQIIRFQQPISVHLFYMTAWVDESGTLQFRKDIYKRDTKLDRALKLRPPSAIPSVEAATPTSKRRSS